MLALPTAVLFSPTAVLAPLLRSLFALGLLAGVAVPSLAQPASPFERGVDAFRAGQYEAAKAAFEAAVAAGTNVAEAHYMLGRLYFEAEPRDLQRAKAEIKKAQKLDPGNVQYLVAELQQLREPSWSRLLEFMQEDERRTLARQILEMDSTNAFAHEDLGRSYIRDYWAYRNAVSLPKLSFVRRMLPNPNAENRPGVIPLRLAPGQEPERDLEATA